MPLQSPATARGSVVLVTGASSGIGAATARLFVQRSACVGLMARDTARLEDLSSELGARTLALPGDVSVSEDAATALDRLEAVFGTVTCAVNAAGICWPIALAQLDGSAWQRVIDTNLTGSFFVAREAGLRMRANGSGSIVNLASEMAVLGAPDYVAYCASKAGVIGLTRALAAELAPTVRVNAVCPGPIDTPMLDAEFSSSNDSAAALQETNDRVPLGRRGTPQEVADAIFFLATASYATGSTLALDGGSTIV